MESSVSNAAIDKLSPTLPLTAEQERLVQQILQFCKDHLKDNNPAVFTIYGDAGTGKSVVLSHLFASLQLAARTQPDSPFYKSNNYFTVNHPEILKVYRELAGKQQHQYKKDYQRPTSLINRLDKEGKDVDVVIVDEAHLLLSKPDHYNNFYHQNQLVELLHHAKVVVLVFDQFQVLRMKSLWTPKRLQKITNRYPHAEYHLHHQFRMTASDELLDWFNQLTESRIIKQLPISARDHYDFRIYDDAEAMHQAIVRRNQEVGLSRILSTSGYPSTLDGGKHYIDEGHFHLPWDQYNFTSTPWAEIPKTINEVGSIYTCQGFDLNYAGIIMGPIIFQIPGTKQIDIDFGKYTDTESLKRRDDLTDPKEIKELKYKMILNALNVILKRGVRGTYIYAHDPLLRKTLYQMFIKRGWGDVLAK
ncbi:DUF2075 domain-containing protein [Limosilactobacillus sp.]|uniref:DUF2075 domain-containing protein n=1 Tax=Limosilactobacillus sp. TaxID=2773925 RepID=UPI00345E4668